MYGEIDEVSFPRVSSTLTISVFDPKPLFNTDLATEIKCCAHFEHDDVHETAHFEKCLLYKAEPSIAAHSLQNLV